MTTATISRTREYLVIKIPLRDFKKREVAFSSSDDEAVQEGLQAVAEGRVSRPFRNAKEAIAHLRKL